MTRKIRLLPSQLDFGCNLVSSWLVLWGSLPTPFLYCDQQKHAKGVWICTDVKLGCSKKRKHMSSNRWRKTVLPPLPQLHLPHLLGAHTLGSSQFFQSQSFQCFLLSSQPWPIPASSQETLCEGHAGMSQSTAMLRGFPWALIYVWVGALGENRMPYTTPWKKIFCPPL